MDGPAAARAEPGRRARARWPPIGPSGRRGCWSPIRPSSSPPRSCSRCTMPSGAPAMAGAAAGASASAWPGAAEPAMQGLYIFGSVGTRQVHADGHVLRRRAGGQEAPRAFQRLHAGGASIPPSLAPRGERRSHPALGTVHRRGDPPALLRRVPGRGHRRCHAARPSLRGPVRRRRRRRRHLQLRARRSLQGRAAARKFPALHRPHQGAPRHPRARRRPGLPAPAHPAISTSITRRWARKRPRRSTRPSRG